MHQPLLHPNQQEDNDSASNLKQAAESKKYKRTCSDYLRRLDTMILKPILIYKYEKDREARA